jgi:hypothetical protein
MPEIVVERQTAERVRKIIVDEPPEEIELESGIILLRNKTTGAASVKDSDLQLNTNQVNLLMFLSREYPRSVYETEITRAIGVKNIKALAEKTSNAFVEILHYNPLDSKKGRHAWQGLRSPGAALNGQGVSVKEEMLFCFEEAATAGGMYKRCSNLNIDFTVREAELLQIFDKHRGQSFDGEAIRAAAIKFSWPDNVITQTMDQVKSKIRGTHVADRLRTERTKAQGNVYTLF